MNSRIQPNSKYLNDKRLLNRKRLKTKLKSFTLVEVIIASAIFTTVGLIAIGIFVNITRIQGRIYLENAIYEDARFMMERISREIRNNAIDYEEYFNKNFTNGTSVFPYGHLHGCYAAQFYNPGTGILAPGIPTTSPDTLGAKCNDGSEANGQLCTIYRPSQDINTGQNPYVGRGNYTSAQASAFCVDTSVSSPIYQNSLQQCSSPSINLKSELYLLDRHGQQKTLFAKKLIHNDPSPEYALAMLRLHGEDSDHDGITDQWQNCDSGTNQFCCTNGFDCNLSAPADTLEKTLTELVPGNPYKGFIPLSPLRTNVTNLSFLVEPIEDPRKAFAETDILAQPRVTITLTVQPALSELRKYNVSTSEALPQITLQTTVSSRIQSEVKSYLGKLPANCPY